MVTAFAIAESIRTAMNANLLKKDEQGVFETALVDFLSARDMLNDFFPKYK